ncbi:hypothetical protein O6H91_23G058500 [Diphasiastrum complanatum]|uniref:Uncharacterized protein n=1 Tax=Diphasiastrum complanatum TaxID=34168 RepID=A0ACC2AB91_DIPCM|nr:hypothetical protein O6H91_23G058500 [Diphasiastrum complanatum]
MDPRKSIGKKLPKRITSSSSSSSSPNYRHDGFSPLPLGMDASPAPRQWNGLHTVWPHDPRTGWSYCATIPSWIVLPKAKNADGAFISPIVFYKVEVGIQSPEGLSTSRGILRRFSDFLKLFAALKRILPKKLLPAAPPKSSLSRINSSHSLLQERRYALEDWMGRLLEDLQVSRSAPIASFLELEAAARSAMNAFSEAQQASNSAVSNLQIPSSSFQKRTSPISGSWTGGGSSVASEPLSSACSDGITTPRTESDKGLEIEMELLVIEQEAESDAKVGPYEDANFGLHNKLESAQGELPRGVHEEEDLVFSDKEAHLLGVESSVVAGEIQVNTFNLSPSSSVTGTEVLPTGNTELLRPPHQRKPSVESLTSESSYRESEPATALVVRNKMGQLLESLPHFDPDFLKEVEITVCMDQRERVKRVISALQRRFAITKADMEDLITRSNQETATTKFLTTKVRDLEAELNTIQHKNRLALQQAISFEHEHVISLQWEVEETRASLMNIEEAVHIEKEGRAIAEEQLHAAQSTCEILEQQILHLTEKNKRLEKDRDSLEAQARADMKVLAKELKNLRRSQPEIQEEIKQAIQAKVESELLLKEEKKKQERLKEAHASFLHEIATLHQRLKECSIDVLAGEDIRTSSKVSGAHDTIELMTTSDNRIAVLLAEQARLLAQEAATATDQPADNKDVEFALPFIGGVLQGKDNSESLSFDEMASAAATRKILTNILVDNALLRKAINSLSRGLLFSYEKSPIASLEEPARKSILNRFL